MRVVSTSPAQEPTGSGVLLGPARRGEAFVTSSDVYDYGLPEPKLCDRLGWLESTWRPPGGLGP